MLAPCSLLRTLCAVTRTPVAVSKSLLSLTALWNLCDAQTYWPFNGPDERQLLINISLAIRFGPSLRTGTNLMVLVKSVTPVRPVMQSTTSMLCFSVIRAQDFPLFARCTPTFVNHQHLLSNEEFQSSGICVIIIIQLRISCLMKRILVYRCRYHMMICFCRAVFVHL